MDNLKTSPAALFLLLATIPSFHIAKCGSLLDNDSGLLVISAFAFSSCRPLKSKTTLKRASSFEILIPDNVIIASLIIIRSFHVSADRKFHFFRMTLRHKRRLQEKNSVDEIKNIILLRHAQVAVRSCGSELKTFVCWHKSAVRIWISFFIFLSLMLQLKFSIPSCCAHSRRRDERLRLRNKDYYSEVNFSFKANNFCMLQRNETLFE